MDKEVLNVDDPRDTFIFMLLERIECLEDRLNKIIEPKIDYINEQRLKFECDTSISSKVAKTFMIKLYHYSSDNQNIIMTLCENVINSIVNKIGVKSLISVSAVIEEDIHEPSHYATIYINMYRRCWVYETIKTLSKIDTPCLMNIEKHMYSAFNSHVSIGPISKGYIYSVFDLKGNYINNPSWKAWEGFAEIYEP
jgi:hypothetical protein